MKINTVAVRNTLQKSEGPRLLWLIGGCQVQSGADEPPHLFNASWPSLLPWLEAAASHCSAVTRWVWGLCSSITDHHHLLHSHPTLSIQSLYCRWFMALGNIGFPYFFKISLLCSQLHHSFYVYSLAFFSKKEYFLSPIYLFIHSFIYLLIHSFKHLFIPVGIHRYLFFTLGYNQIVLYVFCCSCCLRFGYLELFQLAPFFFDNPRGPCFLNHSSSFSLVKLKRMFIKVHKGGTIVQKQVHKYNLFVSAPPSLLIILNIGRSQ